MTFKFNLTIFPPNVIDMNSSEGLFIFWGRKHKKNTWTQVSAPPANTSTTNTCTALYMQAAGILMQQFSSLNFLYPFGGKMYPLSKGNCLTS